MNTLNAIIHSQRCEKEKAEALEMVWSGFDNAAFEACVFLSCEIVEDGLLQESKQGRRICTTFAALYPSICCAFQH